MKKIVSILLLAVCSLMPAMAQTPAYYYKASAVAENDGNGQPMGKVFTWDFLGCSVLQTESAAALNYTQTLDKSIMGKHSASPTDCGFDFDEALTQSNDVSLGYVSAELYRQLLSMYANYVSANPETISMGMFATDPETGMDILTLPFIIMRAEGNPGYAFTGWEATDGLFDATALGMGFTPLAGLMNRNEGNENGLIVPMMVIAGAEIPGMGRLDFWNPDTEEKLQGISTPATLKDAIKKSINALDLGTWTAHFEQTKVLGAVENYYTESNPLRHTDPTEPEFYYNLVFTVSGAEKPEDFIVTSSNPNVTIDNIYLTDWNSVTHTYQAYVNFKYAYTHANGTYEIPVTLTSASDPTSTVTNSFWVVEEYIPSFTLSNLSFDLGSKNPTVKSFANATIYKNNKVAQLAHGNGLAWSVAVESTTPLVFEASISEDAVLNVVYNRSAVGTHTATVTVTATYTDAAGHEESTSKSYTVRGTTLDVQAPNTMNYHPQIGTFYVDDVARNPFQDVNNTEGNISIEVVDGDATLITINDNNTPHPTISASGNYKTGSVTIRSSQEASALVQAKDPINWPITVQKHTPVITWNWDVLHWGTTATNPYVSTSDGTVTLTKTTAESLVSLSGETATIATGSTATTVSFHLAQAETNIYAAAESNYTALVKRNAKLLPLSIDNQYDFAEITVSAGSNIEYNSSEKLIQQKKGSVSDVAANTWVINFDGTPDKLTFTHATSWGNNYNIFESADGSNWSQIKFDEYISNNSVMEVALSAATRYVRIQMSGSPGVAKIKNLSITRKSGFTLSQNKLYIPLRESIGATALTRSLNVNASDNTLLSATSSDPDFTCNWTLDPNGYDAILTVTNNAKTEKQATITITGDGQTSHVNVYSYIAPISLPINFSEDGSDIFYMTTSQATLVDWDEMTHNLSFPAAKGKEHSMTLFFADAPKQASFYHDYNGSDDHWTFEQSANGSSWTAVAGATYDNEEGLQTLPLNATSRYLRIRYTSAENIWPVYMEELTILPAGIDCSTAVCHIGSNCFETLEDAIAYANNTTAELTIVMDKDYTLPAGYYHLPANATLLVPYFDGQESIIGYQEFSLSNEYDIMPYTLTQLPSIKKRQLTFASGVHFIMDGKMELSGQMFTAGSGTAGIGVPSGPCGHLVLSEGADLTVNDGAKMYAWGYVLGKGKVDIRRGGTTYECFQVMDWKGGTQSLAMVGNEDKKAFIVNQYYIQNIEAASTYHAGAHCQAILGVTVMGAITVLCDVGVIGAGSVDEGGNIADGSDVSMFFMDPADDQENTWVRKTFDPVNDKQLYEINSRGYLSHMTISAMGFSFASETCVLPITSNFKIHLLTGYMGITQSCALLPGAEIEVDKEATVELFQSSPLYLYDTEDWQKYVYPKRYATPVKYSPSFPGGISPRDVSTAEALGDATIAIHGTFNVKGLMYTSEHGANIYSTNADAGTLSFQLVPDGESDIYQVTGFTDGGSTPVYEAATMYPALIKNEDGTMANTEGQAVGTSYCYMNGRWTSMTEDGCFVFDNYGQYYIKPAEYVAIVSDRDDEDQPYAVENPDHTYSDAAGQGRFFILMDGCQWWEVVPEGNLYRCLNNDKYYYYDEDYYGEGLGAWQEKTYTITWNNWDGTTLKLQNGLDAIYENQKYGQEAVYLGSLPTREPSADYTYTFTGWTPALAPITDDATYTATFQKEVRKYIVTFLGEKGAEIENHLYTLGEMPVCANEPSKQDLVKKYVLRWKNVETGEFGIGAVTGDATYQAYFQELPPDEYTVTFINYDGTVLQRSSVATGTMPTAPDAPVKTATSEYTYTFAGWSPAITTVDKDITYTATFNEVGKTFAVKFYQEDGTTQIGETQNLAFGAEPVVPAYTPAEETGYVLTVSWTPQVTAVTGDADYTAVINREAKMFSVQASGTGCSFTGTGMYKYGEDVTLTCNPSDGNNFVSWSDGVTDNPRTITAIDRDYVLTAVMAGDEYERNVTPGYYGTICLPKKLTNYSGAIFFQITYIENEIIYLDEVVELQAGMPYIFLAQAAQITGELQGSTAVAAGNHNGLYGSFTKELLTNDGNNYVIYQNQYRQAGANTSVGANRAYIQLNQVPKERVAQSPSRRRVAMGTQGSQVTTDIENVNDNVNVNKLMIDGQLYIIRNNRMYNANGQLVK